MAYRGHKRCDIDGQSDIASLISPPLGLTHTRTHTFLCAALTPPSPSFSLVFSARLWLMNFVSAPSLIFLFFLYYLSLAHLSSHPHGVLCRLISLFSGCRALRPRSPPLISSSAPPVLVCTHQPATQIPIIISQDQTTTTLCEGHGGKTPAKSKPTQHNTINTNNHTSFSSHREAVSDI